MLYLNKLFKIFIHNLNFIKMKKLVLFSALVLTLSIFTSCEKEEPVIQPAIVYTNDPPKEIWSSDQNYLQTYRGYINSEDYAPENKGYHYQSYTDGNGNMITVNAGNWYLLKVHKYYGIYKGQIYVSQAYEMAAIYSDNLLSVQDQVNRTGSAVVFLGTDYANPLGTDHIISGVYN